MALLTGGLWGLEAHAIDLSVSGSWSESVGSSDLQSGAGSDLTEDKTSASSQTSLTLTNTSGSSDNWRVEVDRSDTNWDSGVRLWVRRTSDGTGSGSISSGTTFTEVTAVSGTFFTGAGDRSTINVELKITGLSVDVPVDSYLTSVTYTVVDLP